MKSRSAWPADISSLRVTAAKSAFSAGSIRILKLLFLKCFFGCDIGKIPRAATAFADGWNYSHATRDAFRDRFEKAIRCRLVSDSVLSVQAAETARPIVHQIGNH